MISINNPTINVFIFLLKTTTSLYFIRSNIDIYPFQYVNEFFF